MFLMLVIEIGELYRLALNGKMGCGVGEWGK
jgi:hypothetical protein